MLTKEHSWTNYKIQEKVGFTATWAKEMLPALSCELWNWLYRIDPFYISELQMVKSCSYLPYLREVLQWLSGKKNSLMWSRV